MRIKNIASSAVVFGLTAALMGGTALSQTTSSGDPATQTDDQLLQQGQTQDQMGTQAQDQTRTQTGDDRSTTGTGMASNDGLPRRSIADSTQPYTGDVLAGITADELIGMNVVDASGDSVGSVTDLLLTADDQVDQAIIDVGGFLGFGAKSVAIPLDDLTIAEGDGEVVLNVTRDELDAMSEWTRGNDGWMSN